MPVHVLCQKMLGNDYMKPCLLTRHLDRVIRNSKTKNDSVQMCKSVAVAFGQNVDWPFAKLRRLDF